MSEHLLVHTLKTQLREGQGRFRKAQEAQTTLRPEGTRRSAALTAHVTLAVPAQVQDLAAQVPRGQAVSIRQSRTHIFFEHLRL